MMLTQDELKRMAAEKAVDFVPEDEYIGIGTGSTAQYFIEALANSGKHIKGAVSTSKSTSEAMARYHIENIPLNDTNGLSVYIDGTDEINHLLQMVKGGGGALLYEKIVASAATKFICIADESKYVRQLGKQRALPVEVVPHARSFVARRILKLGGEPELRMDYQTEAGNQILDVHHLVINEPIKMEDTINAIPGVVDNGLFARRPADELVLATQNGVSIFHAHMEGMEF